MPEPTSPPILEAKTPREWLEWLSEATKEMTIDSWALGAEVVISEVADLALDALTKAEARAQAAEGERDEARADARGLAIASITAAAGRLMTSCECRLDYMHGCLKDDCPRALITTTRGRLVTLERRATDAEAALSACNSEHETDIRLRAEAEERCKRLLRALTVWAEAFNTGRSEPLFNARDYAQRVVGELLFPEGQALSSKDQIK